MDDLVERMPCGSSWKTRSVFQGAVGAVCASTVPAASTGPGATGDASRVGPETMVAAKQPTDLGGEQRDAAQDYPESDSETSRILYGPIRLREEGAALRLEVEIYPHLRNRPRWGRRSRVGGPLMFPILRSR